MVDVSIDAVSPATAYAGQTVTVTGLNMGTAGSVLIRRRLDVVSPGGQSQPWQMNAPAIRVNANTMTFVVPNFGPDIIDEQELVVYPAGGQFWSLVDGHGQRTSISTTTLFRVVPVPTMPKITTVSPATAYAGQTVTITGPNVGSVGNVLIRMAASAATVTTAPWGASALTHQVNATTVTFVVPDFGTQIGDYQELVLNPMAGEYWAVGDIYATIGANSTARSDVFRVVLAPVGPPANAGSLIVLSGNPNQPVTDSAGVVHDPKYGTITNPAPSPAAYPGGIAPWPVYTGLTVTVTGPNVGIATSVDISMQVSYAPATYRTLSAPLTPVNQLVSTFTFPNFGDSISGTASLSIRYVIDGQTHLSYPYAVAVSVPPAPTGPAAPVATTSGYGSDIAPGPYWGPLAVARWQFRDPNDTDSTTNTWVVPINPREMSSVWPARTFTQKHTTSVTGQLLLFEGPPSPVNFTFSGAILDADHYDLLRSWVYDRRTAVEITDHYGRVLTVILTQFDAKPKNARGNYWRHEYTVTGMLLSVGRPTLVPTP
jgi:hypothetical protein